MLSAQQVALGSASVKVKFFCFKDIKQGIASINTGFLRFL